MEGLRVARLEPVVELLADRAPELVHELARVDEVERADAVLRDARRLVEEREVGLDLPRGVRPLHLHGDALPVRQDGAVHLADRRRRHRFLLERGEELLDGELELLADHALDLGEGERRDVVLEGAQLDDDVRRHDVGTRREQLPELDERRPELVEHLAQVLAALGRCRLRLERHGCPRPGQEVGQLVRLEPVAEAVPYGDLGDLRHAPEVALLGGLRHAISVARFAAKTFLWGQSLGTVP